MNGVRRGAWLAAALLAAAPFAALAVPANRECATCHIMSLADFKRDDVTPLVAYDPRPVVETGRQDVSSTERMCFSCHDGFVLDSRSVWRGAGHGHPVGTRPSAKVKIPTARGKVVFPLNDDGKVYCGTCHTAHGVDWSQRESPVFMRVKNVDSSMCLACHLDHGTGPGEGNHPVFKRPDKWPAALSTAGGRPGRGGDVICESCHRAHGGAQEKMLVLANSASQLCGTCHADKYRIRDTKHDLSVMAPAARNRQGRTAVESGPCGACHAPHGGSGPDLWARDITNPDPTGGRCLSCHGPDGLAEKKTVGAHTHPINVPVADAGITATIKGWASRFPLLNNDAPPRPLPLYDARGLHVRAGGNVGCGTCHDPHVWSPADAAPGDPRKTEGGAGDSFLRIAADGDGKLCANCHVDKAAVALSKHNPAVMAAATTRAQTKPAQAAPGAARAGGAGVCGACHVPHNAKARGLWARGRGPGAGFTEALCNDCHRDGGEAGKKQAGAHSHPLNVTLPPAMMSRLPLYTAAGRSPSTEAKLDCATCHDPHRWSPDDPARRAGARADVEGDARDSFLRLSAGARAELCVACHAAQRFVRGSDHDLAVTAPNDANAAGQTVVQSGVCGQCHVPHNAKHPSRLWARAPGTALEASERLCRSCHALGQNAAAKIPPQSRHPLDVVVWSDQVRAGFRPGVGAGLPVLGVDGARATTGTIGCVSCHDPHRWSARHAAEGAGRNVEGDVTTSFLRLTQTAGVVCADCHGLDALFRYKYFHGASSRRDYPLYR